MTVIIVAPTIPDLPLIPEEAAGIANAIGDTRLLQGEEATVRGIVNAIDSVVSSGRAIVGFWFASHGNSEGVALSTGIINAISLASLLSAANAQWVVLNTCGSRALVNDLQLRWPGDVVATEAGEIADRDAWEFGRLLAMEYARTLDLENAASTVARGSDRHRYYRNNQHRSAMRTTPTSQDDKLDLLIRIIQGDADAGHKGLRQVVEETNFRVVAIADMQRVQRSELEAVQRQQVAYEASVKSKFDATFGWVRVLAIAVGIVASAQIALFIIAL